MPLPNDEASSENGYGAVLTGDGMMCKCGGALIYRETESRSSGDINAMYTCTACKHSYMTKA